MKSTVRLLRWTGLLALRLLVAFALGFSPLLIGLLAGHYLQHLHP